MTLTPEEKEMIEREAGKAYPLKPEGFHLQNYIVRQLQLAHIKAATKYLLQLKEERERAGKMREALGGIIESWGNRMSGDVEKKIKSNITDSEYWSPIASQVDSEKIAAAREALNNYK